MTVTREAVMTALFALGQNIQWGSPPVTYPTNGGLCWAYTSRRVKTPDQIEGMQPALCQAEFKETTEQAFGVSAKRVWNVAWMIYVFDGNDDTIMPTVFNPILDAIDAAFEPGHGPQNLGGLVERVYLQGEIEKYGGNISGQVLLVVPLQIVVP